MPSHVSRANKRNLNACQVTCHVQTRLATRLNTVTCSIGDRIRTLKKLQLASRLFLSSFLPPTIISSPFFPQTLCRDSRGLQPLDHGIVVVLFSLFSFFFFRYTGWCVWVLARLPPLLVLVARVVCLGVGPAPTFASRPR